jgi:DNA-binding Lrp family transcriptional regulator
MSSQVDKVLMALEACAEDDNDDDVILVEAAHIHNSKDALKYERQIMKFADALVISIEELDNAILTALKGNPTLTIDELANTLKYDAIKVSESIARLTKNGFLEDTVEGFKPTQKALDKPTEPIVSREVYTVYKYDVNPDKPDLKKGGSSRPFCKKLTALSLTKSWSFEKLDNMENDLGTNVWDYRGGYYTNPDTGVVDPDCRHLWYAITKTRKKK